MGYRPPAPVVRWGDMTLVTEDIPNPELRALYTYWAGKRRGTALPSRADIDPAEITALLPHLMLWDVLRDPLDFRVRLAGTEVCRRFGEELTGKRLRQIDLDGMTERFFADYALAVDSQEPRLDMHEYERHDSRYMHYAHLILPLTGEDGQVNMLLVGQRAVGVDGYSCRPQRAGPRDF